MEVVLEKKNKGITGSTLKLIAVITMLIDHSAAVLLEEYMYSIGQSGDISKLFTKQATPELYMYVLLRLIGRIAFPIYCFLLVEGFDKTRSKLKYAVRLFLFALISEIPFNLAFKKDAFDVTYQNVMFTLLIGFVAICLMEQSQKIKFKVWQSIFIIPITAVSLVLFASSILQYMSREMSKSKLYTYLYGDSKWIIAIGAIAILTIVFVGLYLVAKDKKQLITSKLASIVVIGLAFWFAEYLHTDYAGMGVMTILLMYTYRKTKLFSMGAGLLFIIVTNLFEISAAIDMLFVKLYNGEKGLNLKYIFYLFYPVHLLVLVLLRAILF